MKKCESCGEEVKPERVKFEDTYDSDYFCPNCGAEMS